MYFSLHKFFTLSFMPLKVVGVIRYAFNGTINRPVYWIASLHPL